MTETTINQFVSSGTAAERALYTPALATPGAGNDPSVIFMETDTGDTYMWNFGGAAWVKIAEAGAVNAITALTGDVTATGPGSVAATIAAGAVTFAKMQDIATDSLIGRDTAGTGDPENILLNATLSMDGSGNLQRAALTGDVTAGAGSNATTIANDAVTTAKILNANVTLAKIANAAANSKLLGSGAAGAGAAYAELTLGTNLSMSGTTLNASGGGGATSAIVLQINGGGSTITTGIKADLYIPAGCTLTAVTMLADQSGSIVVDIWKDTYANYPPTVADTITAAAKPTISSATKSQDNTLTGWTTAVSAGDTLRFNVDSVTSITRLALILTITVP